MNEKKFTFLDALDELIQEKKKTNKRYSLRAIARDLELDQSNLSKIMKGKRKATANHVLKLSKTLNLDSSKAMSLLENQQ